MERCLRLAARHVNVALVESQRDCAPHIGLRAAYESLRRFAQRREPQTEVHNLGIFETDVLLKVHQVAVEAKRFKFAMRREQQGATWRLVATPRLHSDES